MARVLKQTHEEIVLKARNLFWTEGYQNISALDLATHLEVSPSIIYNKFTKDALLIDSLDSYIDCIANPILNQIQNSEEGIETFRGFYYGLVDALLTKTFPRSCLMVNTVVELHNHEDKKSLSNIYARYFGNIKVSFLKILNKAVELKEVKNTDKLDIYADFLTGLIFGISVLYKIKSKEELQRYIDGQLALIR